MDNLNDMTVAQLKEALEARSLSTDGLKADLLARLEESLAQEAESSQQASGDQASGELFSDEQASSEAAATPPADPVPAAPDTGETGNGNREDSDSLAESTTEEAPAVMKYRYVPVSGQDLTLGGTPVAAEGVEAPGALEHLEGYVGPFLTRVDLSESAE